MNVIDIVASSEREGLAVSTVASSLRQAKGARLLGGGVVGVVFFWGVFFCIFFQIFFVFFNFFVLFGCVFHRVFGKGERKMRIS